MVNFVKRTGSLEELRVKSSVDDRPCHELDRVRHPPAALSTSHLQPSNPLLISFISFLSSSVRQWLRPPIFIRHSLRITLRVFSHGPGLPRFTVRATPYMIRSRFTYQDICHMNDLIVIRNTTHRRLHLDIGATWPRGRRRPNWYDQCWRGLLAGYSGLACLGDDQALEIIDEKTTLPLASASWLEAEAVVYSTKGGVRRTRRSRFLSGSTMLSRDRRSWDSSNLKIHLISAGSK